MEKVSSIIQSLTPEQIVLIIAILGIFGAIALIKKLISWGIAAILVGLIVLSVYNPTALIEALNSLKSDTTTESVAGMATSTLDSLPDYDVKLSTKSIQFTYNGERYDIAFDDVISVDLLESTDDKSRVSIKVKGIDEPFDIVVSTKIYNAASKMFA